MNIAELQPGEMILKYKSLFALERDASGIEIWLREELNKFDRVNDLARAVLGNDSDALAKAAAPDLLRDAKADVAVMEAEYSGKPFAKDIMKRLLPRWRLAKIMREYTRRTNEINVEKKRSRRLNDIWQSAPPIGPWSAPTLH